MKNKLIAVFGLTLLAAFQSQLSSVQAQGTAFTYQGQLLNNGNPAEGSYDLQFTLYNANVGGSPAGPILTNSATAVSNGLFTVTLDFGAGLLTGNNYWLDIAVRTNGAGTFAELSPRQPLTPAPYAVFASTSSNLSGTVSVGQLNGTVGNSQLAHSSITLTAGTGLNGGGSVSLGGSTTLSNTGVLSITGNPDITATTVGGAVTLSDTATSANTASAIVKRDASGNFAAGTVTATGFSGNGANLTSLNANNLTSGTVPLAQLSGITSNQLAVATWQVATNLNGGNAALASNVVSGIGITNAYITNSTFAGNGNGLTNLDATQLSSGVIPLARLPASVLTEGETGASLSGAFSGNGTGLTNLSAAQLTSIGNTNGGLDNFFVGPAGNATMSGLDNTGYGQDALANNTSGGDNTGYGQDALANNTSGRENVAIGQAALNGNESGFDNIAIGLAALGNVTTGWGNIGIGVDGGVTIQTGTNNIDIGNLGSGDESDVIRIGATQTKAVIAGIYPTTIASTAGLVCVNSSGLLGTGSTEGAFLASSLEIGTSAGDYRHLVLGGGNSYGVLYGSYPALADGIHLGYNFYYDASGTPQVLNSGGATSRLTVGYGFISLNIGGVNAAPTTQRLLANSSGVTVNGTFNNSSDRNVKQDFSPVSPKQILQRVLQLPISEWSYKTDASTRHIGPMGQDFYSTFNIGTDEKHIAPIDEGGVALAAIQGLNQKLEEKDAEIRDLKARLEKLEQLVAGKMGSTE